MKEMKQGSESRGGTIIKPTTTNMTSSVLTNSRATKTNNISHL